MCNLYTVRTNQRAIQDATRYARDRTGNLQPLPDIYPDYAALIVRTAADGTLEMAMARWGMLSQMPNKTDAKDAAMLAEIARTGFYRAVRVKSEASQAMRTLLKARNLILGQRMDLDNTIRGLLTSMGVRLPKGPRRWSDRVKLGLEANEALALALRPLLRLRQDLARSLLELTRRLLAEAKGSGLCRRLMTVPGVGAVTACAFVAAVNDPTRFAQSRSVGAYVGLTSRRYQSGEIDYSGRTRAGVTGCSGRSCSRQRPA